MRSSANVIVLLILFVHVHAKEQAAKRRDSAHASMDDLVENVINSLAEKLFCRTLQVSSLHHNELDNSTLAKSAAIPTSYLSLAQPFISPTAGAATAAATAVTTGHHFPTVARPSVDTLTGAFRSISKVTPHGLSEQKIALLRAQAKAKAAVLVAGAVAVRRAPSEQSIGPPAYVPAPGRIVAVGDLHGDLQSFLQVLKLAGLYDAVSDQWIGRDAVLVQIGDVLDRGDEEIELLALLRRLKKQAAAHGGAVITLLGNHEILNAMGIAAFASQNSAAKFTNTTRANAFLPGGDLAAELATWPTACVVGDTAFCHGGLTIAQVASGLTRGNAAVSSWLLNHTSPPLELIKSRDSPLWTRDLSDPPLGEPTPQSCAELQVALELIGAKRLVVGHTPQPHINSACDGLVYRIDVAMSSAMQGGTPQALQISKSGRVKVLTEEMAMAPLSATMLKESREMQEMAARLHALLGKSQGSGTAKVETASPANPVFTPEHDSSSAPCLCDSSVPVADLEAACAC